MYAGTQQSSLHDPHLIWLRSSIFGSAIKRYDTILKRQCILYLRYDLTYIDTQAIIHIPALPDARERVSSNAEIMQEIMTLAAKILASSTLRCISRNFSPRVREFAWKQRTFKNSCFPLRTRYIVIAFYYIQPTINWGNIFYSDPTISSLRVDVVCETVFLSVFASLELCLVHFGYTQSPSVNVKYFCVCAMADN